MYYVRKITLSKWPKPNSNKNEQIDFDILSLRADAVADIRTFNDMLSLWAIPSDSDKDIDQAVLALATSSKQERFDKMDVVVFSEESVKSKGLILKGEDGDTAVIDLKGTHQNIVGLTYGSISLTATIIAEITGSGCHVRRGKKEIESLIKNNINRINIDSFENDSIKSIIQKLISE